MELTELEAAGLNASLYGPPADRVWLYVHGKGGCKEEAADFAALDQGREGIWNRLYDASALPPRCPNCWPRPRRSVTPWPACGGWCCGPTWD